MRPFFIFYFFLNWDFDLEITHLRKKVSKSKIHILSIYEQTDLKTAIVQYTTSNFNRQEVRTARKWAIRIPFST